MENDPINIDELSVLEETIVKGTTLLIRGQPELTPSKVISSVVAHFKRKNFFTPAEVEIVASIIKTYVRYNQYPYPNFNYRDLFSY